MTDCAGIGRHLRDHKALETIYEWEGKDMIGKIRRLVNEPQTNQSAVCACKSQFCGSTAMAEFGLDTLVKSVSNYDVIIGRIGQVVTKARQPFALFFPF